MGINHRQVATYWFYLNGFITLFPPVYLLINEGLSILGLPLTLIYFLAISASCGCSVIYADWAGKKS